MVRKSKASTVGGRTETTMTIDEELQTARELIAKATAIRERLDHPESLQGSDGEHAAGFAEGLRRESDTALAYARQLLERLASAGDDRARSLLDSLPGA